LTNYSLKILKLIPEFVNYSNVVQALNTVEEELVDGFKADFHFDEKTERHDNFKNYKMIVFKFESNFYNFI